MMDLGRELSDEIRQVARAETRQTLAWEAGALDRPLYSVHEVAPSGEAMPAMLWSGGADPQCETISAATDGVPGIVRRIGPDGTAWSFGTAVWYPTAAEAIAAAS